MELGTPAIQEQPNGLQTPAGTNVPVIGGMMFELLFSSEQNNVKYQYVKLYVVIASAGSTTFKANIYVLPEP